jgi:hypothetical protein
LTVLFLPLKSTEVGTGSLGYVRVDKTWSRSKNLENSDKEGPGLDGLRITKQRPEYLTSSLDRTPENCVGMEAAAVEASVDEEGLEDLEDLEVGLGEDRFAGTEEPEPEFVFFE